MVIAGIIPISKNNLYSTPLGLCVLRSFYPGHKSPGLLIFKPSGLVCLIIYYGDFFIAKHSIISTFALNQPKL